MISVETSWVNAVDGVLAAVLFPVAIAILVSGIDDLTLDFVCLYHWLRSRWSRAGAAAPTLEELHRALEKRLAIFVPCWHESPVIAKMIEHNISAINYKSYDFFIGAYPNDEPTLEAVRDLENRFSQVHLAICPHDGPTSKADCLNWIYQRMLLFEEEHGLQFEAVITHDAEDLIHPDSLPITNFYLEAYDMVQIPVLALPTPFRKITHGIYIDEFSEFQLKDMRVREMMGSFIPSNGVGTAYSREALQQLAEKEGNRIFEPGCLTEDYENGMRLHRLGCRQIFVPLRRGPNGFIATREYFPSTLASAIRQRTRWVTGIALQTWERHGWSGHRAQVYWFWRDRKGLVGNPLSLASNLLFLCGFITWLHARIYGHPWGLSQEQFHPVLLAGTLALQALHLTIRIVCVTRLYGWHCALGVPVRVVWGNYVNALATCRAIGRYLAARVRHEPLVWVKTEHAYPSRNALFQHKRRLGEILVGSGYVTEADLVRALASQPPGVRIGEHLVQLGILTEDSLYEALSLQQSLPAGRLNPFEISRQVARSLPRRIIRDWKILPFRIADGSIFLASPEIPNDDLSRRLQGFTRMTLQFRLITPQNFAELARTLL